VPTTTPRRQAQTKVPMVYRLLAHMPVVSTLVAATCPWPTLQLELSLTVSKVVRLR